jgi:Fe2+ or Zn2+ uptake regulation protein
LHQPAPCRDNPRTPTHHREQHSHDDVDQRVQNALDALRGEGGRITTGRRAIVHALMSASDHHATAEGIAEIVQAEHPDVHLSTVYRTLDSLEHLGIVDRVTLGQGGAVYHLVDHVHHHLVCDACGAVIEMPREVLAPLSRTLAQRYAFTMSPSHLTIHGRCDDCRS